MTNKTKHLQIHQMTIRQFERLFPDETACRLYLQRNRWTDGVVRCPRCGNNKVHPHKGKPHNWNCYACSPGAVGYRFSVLVGTIFENTNKPLREWFRVLHMMLTSKKGISALQIYRVMGFGSYNTALLMCNKIRVALASQEFKQLVGVVEMDETFIGGKWENKPLRKRRQKRDDDDPGSRSPHNEKETVIGAVQRKGNVIARVVEKLDHDTIWRFVNEAVSRRVSLLCTDSWRAYDILDEDYRRRAVNHHRQQYVVGAIHTNTIEGFWSIVKRGIVGTFHKVSAKHLPLYVAEFEFRYNNRENPDIFGAAIRAC